MLAGSTPETWSDGPIYVPLLAVRAEQQTWSAEYRTRIEGPAPSLDWIVWQDVSHFLMLERPDEFHAELRRFLAEVGQSGR